MKSRRCMREVDHVLRIKKDASDLFPDSVDIRAAVLKVDERFKNRESKQPTLRSIVNQLPDSYDMFPHIFSKEAIIEAVERVLASKKVGNYRFWFLRKFARQLSHLYPELAATVMERAGDYALKKLGTEASSDFGLLAFNWASDYWLLAGNMEERQESLLKAAALTLQITQQRELFGEHHNHFIALPLYKLGQEMLDMGKQEQALAAFGKMKEECELTGDWEGAAYGAVHCARIHDKARNWPDLRESAEEVVRLVQAAKIKNYLEVEGYFLQGKALLFRNMRQNVKNAIDLFECAKEVMLSGIGHSPVVQGQIYFFLGKAWGIHGELLFEEWINADDEKIVRDAEHATLMSIEYYWEHDTCMKVAYYEEHGDRFVEYEDKNEYHFANAYAMLSTIYTALGETERAETNRNIAINLGFDLSEE